MDITRSFMSRGDAHKGAASHMILPASPGVTQWEMREPLHERDVMLHELQHRIGNSLQIIASILLLKARAVQSEETRFHLQDAHRRIMSIAAVQRLLETSEGEVEVGPYLSQLCQSLAASLIADARPVNLTVFAAEARVSPNEAVSVGLVITELVINALKHAFDQNAYDCTINVSYETRAGGWRLCVADNGGGKIDAGGENKSGLGTGIIDALARQLEARVEISSDAQGYRTVLTHGA